MKKSVRKPRISEVERDRRIRMAAAQLVRGYLSPAAINEYIHTNQQTSKPWHVADEAGEAASIDPEDKYTHGETMLLFGIEIGRLLRGAR
jgi:hypothetical protein